MLETKTENTLTRLGSSDLLGSETLADTQNSDELISTRNVDEEEKSMMELSEYSNMYEHH